MQLSTQLQQQLVQAVRTSKCIEGYRSAAAPQRATLAQALMAQHQIGVGPANHPSMILITSENGKIEKTFSNQKVVST